MTDAHERRRHLAGVILMILGSLCFSGVDALSKLLADTQSVGQIVWARYALAIPVVLLTTHPGNWRALIRTNRPGLQILRGLSPLVISVSMVFGVRYLPLAEATVILFAGPFLLVALSGPFLGEEVHPASWIGVTVGFGAVLLVARPGFGHVSIYALFPALAAIFFAIFQLLSRRLGALGERANTTLTWTLIIGAVVATPLAIVTWQPVDRHGWFLMVALGVVFGVSQSLVIRAFTFGTASTLAVFGYAQVAGAAVLGYLLFDAVPDWYTVAGVIVLIAAGADVARVRARALA
jgi:drug/metabolite transporter (DMT)-like permease